MPITDFFESLTSGLNSPAIGGFDITPDNGTDLATMPRALMVGGAGDAAVICKDGSSITLPALAPGAIYPVRVARVLATGTTATDIKGLY